MSIKKRKEKDTTFGAFHFFQVLLASHLGLLTVAATHSSIVVIV